jgi:kynurenine formamidase
MKRDPAQILQKEYAYGDSPLQKLKTYKFQGDKPGPNWVVFIHGGAWRDKRNSMSDADGFITRFLSQALTSQFSGASIDYRLSPEVHHPDHLYDVIEGLRFLTLLYEVEQIVLVGHSAGAFISLQAVTKNSLTESDSSILSRIKTVVCSEGIYDLPSLVEEYPSYRDFVENAFGPNEDAWKRASPFRNGIMAGFEPSLSVVFVQSSEDELLSFRQSAFATQRWEKLIKNKDKLKHDTYFYTVTGKHDDVFKSDALVCITALSITHNMFGSILSSLDASMPKNTTKPALLEALLRVARDALPDSSI